MSLGEHFDDLMDVLGVDDRRHKSAPPRHVLLAMAVERIKHDRAALGLDQRHLPHIKEELAVDSGFVESKSPARVD